MPREMLTKSLLLNLSINFSRILSFSEQALSGTNYILPFGIQQVLVSSINNILKFVVLKLRTF